MEFTKRQQAICMAWSMPVEIGQDEFIPSMCKHFRPHPNGMHVVCLETFLFTRAISLLTATDMRLVRWCYKSYLDAFIALDDWQRNSFYGKPNNFIAEKGFYKNGST